ncbi:MAG: PaaI family thioesterase [Clostridia bacterium]|nr:PaaI family thioesterase [Clostridia bacterium]
MQLKVLKKQNSSADCIVCGLSNNLSLKVRFYECEGDILCGVFHNEDWHQSFPGRMHGGMIGAVLDETIGRAIMIRDPDQWGVTGELKIRYIKPTPLNADLLCWGKIVSENSRLFKGVGYLETIDGEVVATAEATFFKMDITKITDDSFTDENWYFEDKPIPAVICTENLTLLDKLSEKMKK